jgi:hypothetical protein
MVRIRPLVRYIDSDERNFPMSYQSSSPQPPGKHGLIAKQLAIQPEDQAEFNDLLAQYQQEINPQGPIQQTLFDELITAAWNLRRVRILESELNLLDPRSDRLARHHSRFERTLHRSLKELKALQTDAALHQMLPREVRHRTPLLASPLKIAKRAQERDKAYAEADAKIPPLRSWLPKPEITVVANASNAA